ncbi:MAG TPA: FG-GAP repeat protein, partial [Candidatus Binatia bacterium]
MNEAMVGFNAMDNSRIHGGHRWGSLLLLCLALSPIVGSPVTAYSGTWEEVAKLTANDGALNDRLGHSVAISGNTAAIGTPFKEGLRGAVYVFERDANGAWTLAKKVTAMVPLANASFGESVAVDGDRLIVGSPGTNFDKGSAYVFERDSGGPNNWGQVAELTANDGAGSDRFGISVGISGDTVVVGAFNDDLDDVGSDQNGSAYVFEPNGANWSQITKLH